MSTMAQRFETRQWLPYPVELVFAFFANPRNLPHLMPAELATRIDELRPVAAPERPLAADPRRRYRSPAAGVGTEMWISFKPNRFLPRMHWQARIVEFAWYSHFTDEQVRGPFQRFRHRHGVEAQTENGVEGSLITDSIEFVLPAGVLGLAASLVVRKQLERSFAARQERLPQILERAAEQATRQS